MFSGSCYYCYPVFLLQTEFAEDDPGIQITYADEVSIHNCLGLPSISTMGPPDVPILTQGKKKVFC